jgi:ABC-type uncharacterized transport system substrate-binding protein
LAELVGSTPNVIVVASNTALAELLWLTTTIPIVFTRVADPGADAEWLGRY